MESKKKYNFGTKRFEGSFAFCDWLKIPNCNLTKV